MAVTLEGGEVRVRIVGRFWIFFLPFLVFVFSDQNDVVAGHSRNLGELEGARSVKERSGGGSVGDQQAPQEASS